MDDHGVDTVARLIEESDLSYPVSARRLLGELALRNVNIDEHGNSVMVGEVVDPSEVREFTSREDLERKLEPVFERERAERQPGLVGRLRHFLGR